LKVREEQLQALAANQEEAFVRQMVSHLNADFKEHLTKQGLKSEQVEPLVRLGISRAKKYSVVKNSDVQLYIECMVLLSPDFDESSSTPWAGETLRRSDIEGREKMDTISDHMLFGMEGPQ